MQMHRVDVEPLLNKMGVQYDPTTKYLGKNGKYIGKPAAAAVNNCNDVGLYEIKV
jgi:heterodisulfide reductase subunit B